MAPFETQAERTRFSWRRTTLATTLVVLLIGRLAIHDGVTVLSGLGLAFALMAWLAILGSTHRRIQAISHRVPAVIGHTLPIVAASMVVFATIGIVMIIIGGAVHH
jgi:Domain of unknown function (DUF202)